MADEYWDKHKAAYGILGYIEIARRQKEDLLCRIAGKDEIREGITVESDSPDFLRLSALAREAFPAGGPFAYISLRPDPWKSPDAWRITADGQERYIWTGMVQKCLDKGCDGCAGDDAG